MNEIHDAMAWRTAWTASAQGPYPVGNPSAQPDLRFALPSPDSGATDQTFRLMVRPDIWGGEARLRFSNVFGTRPVTIDGVYVGLHLSAAAVVRDTNRQATFGGSPIMTVGPGASVWSDGVALPFVNEVDRRFLFGRKLAVSFHIRGESGPMTWHAKAVNTSYISAPGSGAVGGDDGETHFPYSTTSWFFLDAVDMLAPATTRVAVCFGDSLTDGSCSTLNGEDRWPDAFSRIVHGALGDAVSVVNAGIGGNEVAGPKEYTPRSPDRGGPSGRSRMDRDVLGLSGVESVIWLEGINDLKHEERTAEEVFAAMRRSVAHIKGKAPHIRVIGATVPTALGSTIAGQGSPEQDAKRKMLNASIRDADFFDAVLDFEAVLRDDDTGRMREEFVPDSTAGNPGDRLHPNRAGYLRMAESVDWRVVFPDVGP